MLDEHHSDYKIESNSMFLNGYNSNPTQSQPSRFCKLKCNNPDCESAMGQHLLDNKQCAANYNDKRFKILAVAHNLFHLCLLEATFTKTRHPILCKQKEFVYTLKLFK